MGLLYWGYSETNNIDIMMILGENKVRALYTGGLYMHVINIAWNIYHWDL